MLVQIPFKFFKKILGHSHVDLHSLDATAPSDLEKIFSWVITPDLLVAPSGMRKRHFTLPIVFWGFLSQVLNPFSSCREALRQIQSKQYKKAKTVSDSNTSGYCQARAKIPLEHLEKILKKTSSSLVNRVCSDVVDRPLRLLDCTSFSMPDTPELQEVYPQIPSQKKGCGFPLVKVGAVFNAATGGLQDYELGPWKTHDARLGKKLVPKLPPNSIVIADRGFSGFAMLQALRENQCDFVGRLHQNRKVDFKKAKKLAPNDWLVSLDKPKRIPAGMSPEDYDLLPEFMLVRVIHFKISHKGFRCSMITLCTTLLDESAYPAQKIAELFGIRWEIETDFRHLKITLGMDVLRCLSPEMIHREILMNFIAYNLIRGLMIEAAERSQQPLSRISFKGTVDTLRQWTPLIAQEKNKKKRNQLIDSLLQIIASDPVAYRLRHSPRVVKKRPKPYGILTCPRRLYKTSLQRN